MDEIGGAVEWIDDPNMVSVGVAVLASRFFGQDAVVWVSGEQVFDDGLLACMVDLCHKIIDLFL